MRQCGAINLISMKLDMCGILNSEKKYAELGHLRSIIWFLLHIKSIPNNASLRRSSLISEGASIFPHTFSLNFVFPTCELKLWNFISE